MSVLIVKGRPVSIRASSRSRNKKQWKDRVKNAARRVFPTPLDDIDLKITITIFYNSAPDFDTDNISKPICDALEGVAYHNDNQLMDRNARRRDINSSFRLEDVEPELAIAIAEGEEFVAIQIEKVGSGAIEI